MKLSQTLFLLLTVSAASLAIAQSSGMKDMDMKGMERGQKGHGTHAQTTTHKATGVVKAVDPEKGTVTLAHGPVKSLKWPAMTMTFMVKDKRLFDKLAVDKKVKVDFVKHDTDYVVTAVK